MELAEAVEQLHSEMQRLVGATDADLAKGMLAGWALTTEWIGEDGDRWMYSLASEGAKSWQVAGWLHHAGVTNDAGIVRGALEDGD